MTHRDKNRTNDPTAERRSSSHPNEAGAWRAAIGARLKAARQMAGLSQGQVAQFMDLHRPSVSEAEAGRRRVSAEELAQFAQYYGVSTEWISGAGPEVADPKDVRVELAARELAKLKSRDLDRVLQLLAALRGPGDNAP